MTTSAARAGTIDALIKMGICPAWKFWGITMTMNLADFREVTDFVDGGWTEDGLRGFGYTTCGCKCQPYTPRSIR